MTKTEDRRKTLPRWPTRELSLPSIKRGKHRLPTNPLLRSMRRSALIEARELSRTLSGRLIHPGPSHPRPVLATLPTRVLCAEIWYQRGVKYMPKMVEIMGRGPLTAEVIRVGRSSPSARRSYYRMLKEKVQRDKLEALLMVSNI